MRLGSCTVQALTTAELLAEASKPARSVQGWIRKRPRGLFSSAWEGTQILARADRSGPPSTPF